MVLAMIYEAALYQAVRRFPMAIKCAKTFGPDFDLSGWRDGICFEYRRILREKAQQAPQEDQYMSPVERQCRMRGIDPTSSVEPWFSVTVP